MTKTVKQILIDARNLISDKKKWIQGDYARNHFGAVVYGWEDDAICWCSVGAVQKMAGITDWEDPNRVTLEREPVNLLNEIVKPVSFHISAFNDSHTHEEVLAVFDKAIESLDD